MKNIKISETADTTWKKFRGLMFRKNFNHALLFKLNKKTRLSASIHSLFVFFPFDIVWLADGEIVDMSENVKPFILNMTPRKPADAFIELPAGEIKKRNLKVGDEINLSEF